MTGTCKYHKLIDVKLLCPIIMRWFSFSNVGITHYDLFFPDGTCPPRHILLKFLQISEESDAAIAVHCKVMYKKDSISYKKIKYSPCIK